MSASPAARAEAPIEGILWMFATTLSFAGVNIIVHHLGPAIPATQSAFLRFAFGIVLVLPGFMQIPRGGLPAKIWGLFGLRGALQAVAVLLWFYAMARVPIADVTAIGYLNPIVVTLGGALLLGEGFSWRRGLAIGVAMLGALVILRPGLREIQPGHVAQLCAALFFGISYLEMKRLSRHAPAGLIVAMMTLTVAVCLLPEVMRTQLGTSFYFGGTSLLIVVVVVMDFIAQIQAHLMSHQYESLLKKANLKGGSRGGLAPRG
jgi:drug/metabolite transporter (DMT)-like permease